MEALIISFCFILLTSLLAVLFLKFSGEKSKARREHQLPPGPWTLPVIGSLHHLVTVLPHQKITELCRRHGPLMLLKLGEVPTVVVSSAEAVAQATKTNDITFASRPSNPTQRIVGCGGRGIIYAPYGEHWRQMRKVCMVELLSSMQLRRMESIRPEEVGRLLGYIAAAAATGATVNLSEKAMSLSNNVVSRAVFGGKFLQQEEYIRELDVVLTLLGGFSLVDLFPSSRLAQWLSTGQRRMKRSYAHMQRIIENIIEARKAARDYWDDDDDDDDGARSSSSSTDDEDLLDVLLRLEKEDSLELPLTGESICTVLFDIFSGATDTTGIALEWAMSELVRHPHVMAKAQLEIQDVLGRDRVAITQGDLSRLRYMRMVIKEVLRLHPPAPLIPRTSRSDCKILGYDILEGTTVLINIFGVSRNPKYWKDPEEFLPERFENNDVDYTGTHFEFTPFGAGRRQCPGIIFATSTLEIALANFIYHFDWVVPGGASPESLNMSEKFGITVRRRYDLELIAIPRRPLNISKHI